MPETYRRTDADTGLDFFVSSRSSRGEIDTHDVAAYILDNRFNAALCRAHARVLNVLVNHDIRTTPITDTALEDATTRGNDLVNRRLGPPEGYEDGDYPAPVYHPVLVKKFAFHLGKRAIALDERADRLLERFDKF